MANIFIFLYFTVINKSAKYEKLRKYTAQKIKFSIKDFFSKCVKFTEEILNEKLHFFCSDIGHIAFGTVR